MRFAIVAGVGPALVQADATLLKRGKKGLKAAGEQGGLVYFWLKRSVTQRPDPSVFPTSEQFFDNLRTITDSYVARVTQRGGRNG